MSKRTRKVERLDIGLIILSLFSIYALFNLGVTWKDIAKLFFQTLLFLSLISIIAKKLVKKFKEIRIK